MSEETKLADAVRAILRSANVDANVRPYTFAAMLADLLALVAAERRQAKREERERLIRIADGMLETAEWNGNHMTLDEHEQRLRALLADVDVQTQVRCWESYFQARPNQHMQSEWRVEARARFGVEMKP